MIADFTVLLVSGGGPWDAMVEVCCSLCPLRGKVLAFADVNVMCAGFPLRGFKVCLRSHRGLGVFVPSSSWIESVLAFPSVDCTYAGVPVLGVNLCLPSRGGLRACVSSCLGV